MSSATRLTRSEAGETRFTVATMIKFLSIGHEPRLRTATHIGPDVNRTMEVARAAWFRRVFADMKLDAEQHAPQCVDAFSANDPQLSLPSSLQARLLLPRSTK